MPAEPAREPVTKPFPGFYAFTFPLPECECGAEPFACTVTYTSAALAGTVAHADR